MALIQDIYKITPATSATMASSLLFDVASPVKKVISIDFAKLDQGKDKNTSVIWHFGDPFSATNEYVFNSILDVPEHTYTYAGNYKINCIANMNGTIFHLKKDIILTPISNYVIPSVSAGTYPTYVNNGFAFDIDLICFANNAPIYYSITGSAGEFIRYTGTLTFTDDFDLFYYCVLSDGTISALYNSTYILVRSAYTLDITPLETFQPSAFNMIITSTPDISGDSNFRTVYTTSQNQNETEYLGPVLIEESTTINAWIIQTYNGDEYTYDVVGKTYIIPPSIGEATIPDPDAPSLVDFLIA
jgi:hypothetical protein